MPIDALVWLACFVVQGHLILNPSSPRACDEHGRKTVGVEQGSEECPLCNQMNEYGLALQVGGTVAVSSTIDTTRESVRTLRRRSSNLLMSFTSMRAVSTRLGRSTSQSAGQPYHTGTEGIDASGEGITSEPLLEVGQLCERMGIWRMGNRGRGW